MYSYKPAPNNFSFTYGDKHAYVIKQPGGAEEVKDCKRAMDECPVGAIEDNGMEEHRQK